MTIAEGTRSKTNQGEMETMAALLQELVRKMEMMDSRLSAVESSPNKGKEKGDYSEEEDECRLSIKFLNI